MDSIKPMKTYVNVRKPASSTQQEASSTRQEAMSTEQESLNTEKKPIMTEQKSLGTKKQSLSTAPESLSTQKKFKDAKSNVIVIKREALKTKKAVELLLSGTLKSKVCRYCLHITYPLSELNQIMQIGGRDALYKVTIRDIVASFHPFKVVDDPNFPNKICEKCLDKAIRSYLFAQQCEQSERALRNCFDDMYEKLEKLDPLERPHKRGRQKQNPNHNILRAEHQKVMEYAEPIRNLINTGSVSYSNEPKVSELECIRCWQVLPSVESLANHEQIHPKSMWYHCRLCGKSMARKFQMKRHLRIHAKGKAAVIVNESGFICKQCGAANEDYNLHLQHIEIHKFRMIMEHLVERKIDKLCSVCLNKSGNMVEMDKIIRLHGGYPELTGERTMYNILGSTVPELNIPHNYMGTKICEKCLDHAITSYIFINRTHYIRNRLEVCVTKMVEMLKDIQPETKLCIEIAQNGIMPLTETFDDNLLLNDDEIEEHKLKVDVLEDEFRTKSDEESSDDEKLTNASKTGKKIDQSISQNTGKLVNGYTINSDNLGEFLTFKKKEQTIKKTKCRYTCPLCNKHFISDYFLKKHVLKHIRKKVECKICRENFKSRFHLREHTKMAHILYLKSYSTCQFCSRTFKDAHKILAHEKCHVLKQCDLCSKTFVSQKYYEGHMQRHVSKWNLFRRKRIQTCSFCEKECSNDNDLSIHVNKVHLQIKPYSCDMCEKQFYTEQNLKYHKYIHNVFSKEKCEFCSKPFKCRKSLVLHIRKHLGIKPYQCLLCSETFYSDSKVNHHMRKWHGGTFCCRLCKKVFMYKRGLKNHVNIAHSIF